MPVAWIIIVTATRDRPQVQFSNRAILRLAFHRAGGVAKSVLDVSSPVAKASAAALINDCA
jgi:hypothetical protein